MTAKENLKLPSAKSHRASARRQARNGPLRTRAKTHLARARAAMADGDIPAAEAQVRSAVVALDKAAKKGAIHRGNASRRKSRIMRQLAAAQTDPAT